MNPNVDEDGVLGGFQTLCVTTSEHSSGIAPQSATLPQQRWPMPVHAFPNNQWPLNMSPPVLIQPFNSMGPHADQQMYSQMQAQAAAQAAIRIPASNDRPQLYTTPAFGVAPSMYSAQGPRPQPQVSHGATPGSVFVNGRWIHYGKVPDVQSLSNENSPNQSPYPSTNFHEHTLADYVSHQPNPSAIVVDPVWPFIQPTGPNQSLSSLNGTCYSTSTSHLLAPSTYDDHPSSLSVQSYNTSPNHGSPASRSHSPAAYVDDDGVTTVNALVEGKFIPEPSDMPTHARRNSVSHIIYDPLTITPTYTNYNSGHHPGSMTARGRPSHFDDPWQQYRDPSQSFSSQASTGSTRSSVSSRAVSAASDLDDGHSERSDAVDNPSRATSNSLSQSHNSSENSPRRNESNGSLGGTTRSRSGSKRRRAPALASTSELEQDVGPGTVAPSSSPSNSPRAARQDSDATGGGDDDDSPRSHSSKRARSRGKSRPRATAMALSRQQEISLLGAEQVDPRRYAIHSTNPKKSKVKGACQHHTHVITVRERRVRMVLINGVELMSSGAFTGQCMVRIRVADKSTTTGDRAATVFAWNYYETSTEPHSNGKDIIIDLPRMGSRLIKASPRAVEAARCSCDIALFKLEILLPAKPDSGRRSAFIPALVTTR